jgi:hypothetical protein
MSLSLFSSVNIAVLLTDGENLDYNSLKLPDERWNHISIILQNNNVVYLLNGKVIKKVIDFSPKELVIKLRKPTFIKIHNCKYFSMSSVLQT